MSVKITEECIACGACEAECPNEAIYEAGKEQKNAIWEYVKPLMTGLRRKNRRKHAMTSDEIAVAWDARDCLLKEYGIN